MCATEHTAGQQQQSAEVRERGRRGSRPGGGQKAPGGTQGWEPGEGKRGAGQGLLVLLNPPADSSKPKIPKVQDKSKLKLNGKS